MARPTILINSASGSDSAASGAGPGTALTGTAASYVTTVVTLDGSPNLSGVDTTGLAVLYLVTSTGRKFFRITAVDNTAKTVTVSVAPTGTATGLSWAIGGKRASLGSASSSVLLENGGSTGDAQPGWILEWESGHTESHGGTLNTRVSGDATDGPIILRGTAGAGTKPILTFTNNGAGFAFPAAISFFHWRDFEVRNTNGTKTASLVFSFNTASAFNGMQFERLTCNHATNKFWKFTALANGANLQGSIILGCDISNCASVGLDFSASPTCIPKIINNIIKGNGSHGINTNQVDHNQVIMGNIIAGNSGDGLRLRYRQQMAIVNNTIDSNTGAGINFVLDPEAASRGVLLMNNIISNNGTYGVIWFDGTTTQAAMDAYVTRMNNCYYNNTTNKYQPTTLTAESGEVTTNPTFTNAASNDYSVGTNMKALGYPTANIGTGSGTRSYEDLGAAQRQESSGGGLLRPASTNGGTV